MTRTVADAAAELGAIAGKDPEDPATATGARHRPGLPRRALRRRRSPGKRIGVITNTNAAVHRRDRGDPGARGDDGHGHRADRRQRPLDILTPEFKRDLNAYFSRLPASAPMKTLADIIAYNAAHAARRAQVRPDAADRSQATDLTDPAAERGLRHGARHPAPRRAAGDRQRAHARHADPADNVEAIMTPRAR